MTPLERDNPKIINGSRRLRIANGSGVKVSDVNQLVDRFFEARKMMGGMGIPGMTKRSATKSNKNARKTKKGKNSQARGRNSSQSRPRVPANFPATPQGYGQQTQLPPGLPPGMQMPDLSRLNLPKD